VSWDKERCGCKGWAWVGQFGFTGYLDPNHSTVIGLNFNYFFSLTQNEN